MKKLVYILITAVYISIAGPFYAHAGDHQTAPYMHAVAITFTDNDHIVQKWTMFDKGKDKGGVTFELTRVK